ncbi:hypothetical protein D3C87_2203050 [compost metagenome]
MPSDLNSGWPVNELNIDEGKVWTDRVNEVLGLPAVRRQPDDVMARSLDFAL